MRFVLQNPAVSVVIPGMYCAEEIAQNVAAAKGVAPLTEAELAAIADVRAQLGENFCRRWPQWSLDGIRVLANLRAAHKNLAAQIAPKVYEYGFLKQ
jgi:hypothetical protein